jgi:molecular chaperone IbpA
MTTSLIDALFRDTIGYDPLARFAEATNSVLKYPPHNISIVGENQYKLTIAVAGFGKDNLSISVEDGHLIVRGAIKQKEETDEKLLYRGLALRDFDRVWQLGEYVEVVSVDLKDGILSINMERKPPESKRARSIPIL